MRLGDRVSTIRERLGSAGAGTCVVVGEERIVLGLLRSDQLEGNEDRTAEEAMRPGPSTFRPNAPLVDLARLMAEHDLPDVPITTNDGELIGLITRNDATRVAAEIHQAGQEHEHG